jgi:hypothetical protein
MPRLAAQINESFTFPDQPMTTRSRQARIAMPIAKVMDARLYSNRAFSRFGYVRFSKEAILNLLTGSDIPTFPTICRIGKTASLIPGGDGCNVDTTNAG